MKHVQHLSSVHNDKVKQWSKLLTRKGRESYQQFLVEGPHLLEELFTSPEFHQQVEAVIYQEDRKDLLSAVLNEQLLQLNIPVYSATDRVMGKLTDTENPRGVVAVVNQPSVEQQRAVLLQIMRESKERGFFLLMVDRVQDPGNLGTMIRTADAAGLDGVILGQGTVDLYNPKTVRSTMGSLFHLPIAAGPLPEWMDEIRGAGGLLIGTTPSAGASLYEEPVFDARCAVIIGNEGEGMDARLLEMVDRQVRIPIYGRAESLNAAIAASIIMYEGVRQRNVHLAR